MPPRKDRTTASAEPTQRRRSARAGADPGKTKATATGKKKNGKGAENGGDDKDAGADLDAVEYVSSMLLKVKTQALTYRNTIAGTRMATSSALA